MQVLVESNNNYENQISLTLIEFPYVVDERCLEFQ
jgi:hypothetical protein